MEAEFDGQAQCKKKCREMLSGAKVQQGPDSNDTAGVGGWWVPVPRSVLEVSTSAVGSTSASL